MIRFRSAHRYRTRVCTYWTLDWSLLRLGYAGSFTLPGQVLRVAIWGERV